MFAPNRIHDADHPLFVRPRGLKPGRWTNRGTPTEDGEMSRKPGSFGILERRQWGPSSPSVHVRLLNASTVSSNVSGADRRWRLPAGACNQFNFALAFLHNYRGSDLIRSEVGFLFYGCCACSVYESTEAQYSVISVSRQRSPESADCRMSSLNHRTRVQE